MSVAGIRLQRSDLPYAPRTCLIDKPCPYRDAAQRCDDPRTNKGNSDSACHRMSNKALLEGLTA